MMRGSLPTYYFRKLKMNHERQRSVVGNGPDMGSHEGPYTFLGPLTSNIAESLIYRLRLTACSHVQLPALTIAAPIRPRHLP